MGEMLRPDERLAILGVARGSKDNPDYEDDRRHAVAAHHRCILAHKAAYYRDTPEGRFMSEIDNKCPDLMLRVRYRNELLNPGPTTSKGERG